MKTREWRIEDGGWRTRSVLECGGPPPLSDCGAGSNKGGIRPDERSSPCESARGLAQSKTWWLWFALICVLPSALSLSAQAQYSIDWYTIDGGGGTSTGGVYSVSGTIGQPDASGPMTGGNFSVTGGFWALPTAVPSSNAPALLIVPAAPGWAILSWAPATPGFVLQESWSLASPVPWTNSPSSATNPIAVPATLPVKFYRLHQP